MRISYKLLLQHFGHMDHSALRLAAICLFQPSLSCLIQRFIGRYAKKLSIFSSSTATTTVLDSFLTVLLSIVCFHVINAFTIGVLVLVTFTPVTANLSRILVHPVMQNLRHSRINKIINNPVSPRIVFHNLSSLTVFITGISIAFYYCFALQKSEREYLMTKSNIFSPIQLCISSFIFNFGLSDGIAGFTTFELVILTLTQVQSWVFSFVWNEFAASNNYNLFITLGVSLNWNALIVYLVSYVLQSNRKNNLLYNVSLVLLLELFETYRKLKLSDNLYNYDFHSDGRFGDIVLSVVSYLCLYMGAITFANYVLESWRSNRLAEKAQGDNPDTDIALQFIFESTRFSFSFVIIPMFYFFLLVTILDSLILWSNYKICLYFLSSAGVSAVCCIMTVNFALYNLSFGSAWSPFLLIISKNPLLYLCLTCLFGAPISFTLSMMQAVSFSTKMAALIGHQSCTTWSYLTLIGGFYDNTL